MIRVHTRDWAACDRVERWRGNLGKRVIAAEVAAPGDLSGPASVDSAMEPERHLSITRMRLKDVRKERDRSWFADGAEDLTLMICMSGGVRFDTADRRGLLRPGELALFSHQVPLALDWKAGTILILQIPRALLSHLGRVERFVGRVFSRWTTSATLLCIYAETFADRDGGLPRIAERHLAELTADALSMLDEDETSSEHGRQSASAARAALMRRLIAEQARDARFGLDQAARAAGVSLRTAERDLNRAGTRFSDEVMKARLSYAQERLTIGGGSRISDIAYDAGFGDLSHFNRCFKASFGCSPSEWRRRSSTGLKQHANIHHHQQADHAG